MVSFFAIVSSLAQSTASLAQSTVAPPPDQPPAGTATEQGESPRLGVSTIVDLEGNIGYSSNPQLIRGGSGQLFGRGSIYVAHARQDARSSTVLSAFGENSIYSGRAGSQQLFRATASHTRALTEKVQIFGNVSASLDRGGQLGNRLIGSPNAPVPITPELIPVFPDNFEDLSLIGSTTYRLSGQAGAQVSISQRDSLSFSAGADRAMFKGLQSDNDFTGISGSAAWNRVLSERASAGLSVNVRHSDYQRGRSSSQINPQVQGRLQIAERLDLSGAIGVSFAQNDDGIDKDSSIGLTFNGSICGRRAIETYCARISRDNQSDTIAGPSTSSSFDLSYSRRIDQNQSLQLSAGASQQSQRFDESTTLTPIGKQTYLRAAAAYTRTLSPRWLTGLNLAARSLRRDGADPKPDVSASLFVRWRVGDLR